MWRQRLRSFSIKITLSLAALLLSFAAIEIIARYWEASLARGPRGWEDVASRRIEVEPSNDPRINAVLRPERGYVWEGIPVHINAKGLRDDERGFEKREGVFRILILGDSVAFGWGVRLEDTYGKLLERRLQHVGGPTIEVINAGIPGWDLPIEAAYLERSGVAYAPDLIIAALTVQNDIYRTVYQIPPPTLTRWLREHTYTWNFIASTTSGLRSGAKRIMSGAPAERQAPAFPFPPDEADPVWDEMVRRPLARMAELAKQMGATLVVVVIPTDRQVRDAATGYPTTPQSVVQRFGRERGVRIVDPLPSFASKYAEMGIAADAASPLFADGASHPSALGHRLLADSIEPQISAAFLPR